MPVIDQNMVIGNLPTESYTSSLHVLGEMSAFNQFNTQEVMFASDSDNSENFPNFFVTKRKTRKRNSPQSKSISTNTLDTSHKAGSKTHSLSQNSIYDRKQNKNKINFLSQTTKQSIMDKQLNDIFNELKGSYNRTNYSQVRCYNNLKNTEPKKSQQILRKNQVYSNSQKMIRRVSSELFCSQYSQSNESVPKKSNMKEKLNEEASSQQLKTNIPTRRNSTRSRKRLNLTNNKLSESCTSLYSQSLYSDCVTNIDTQRDVNISQNLMEAFDNITNLIMNTNNKYFEEIAASAKPNTFDENAVDIRDAFTDTMQFINCISSSQSSSSQSYVCSQEFSLNKLTKKIDVISCEDQEDNELSSTSSSRKLQLGLYKILKDPSLIYKGPILEELDQERKRDVILTKIRTVFDSLNEDIKCGKKLALKYRTTSWSNTIFQNERLLLKPMEEAKFTLTKMDNKSSAQKFKIMVYLLKKAYNLIVMNTTCTKRELYYQMVQFIKTQRQIDGALNSVCCMLEVPPWDLGIFSTSKGLVYGKVTLTFSEDEIINCNIKGGTLIPSDMRNLQKVVSKSSFILIVEKDSIFQKLLSEDLPNKLSKSFILITGKGYADIGTRLFIKTLWTLLSIPMFIMVDCDPHGIEIMLSYRFGSLATAHLSNELALPSLRWLGVHPSEIEVLNIENQAITTKDERKLKSLLTRPYITKYDKLKYEIQVLLNKRRKAEIEGVIKSNEFLSNFYIPNKLYGRDFM